MGNGAVAAAVILCCLRAVGAEHSSPALPVQVKIPKSISGEERKLMEQLRELQGAKPASRGWF